MPSITDYLSYQLPSDITRPDLFMKGHSSVQTAQPSENEAKALDACPHTHIRRLYSRRAAQKLFMSMRSNELQTLKPTNLSGVNHKITKFALTQLQTNQ